YTSQNALQRPATTYESHDVFIRVIAVNGEGQEHLNVLRKIARGPESFRCNNHALPMLYEIHLEDIVFGVFALVDASMTVAYNYWPKNSVGDLLDMTLQMLEALDFIHGLNIAHRWQLESLLEGKKTIGRPRVSLIDFENAIQFPPEYSEKQCIVSGHPIGGSFTDAAEYARPSPPECATGKPYNAFKLDVWQLGSSLKDFKTNITSIDGILDRLRQPDCVLRPRAGEAFDSLKKIGDSMSSDSLSFAPPKVR
ncbi:hypothetical protein CPC08DRAFT_636081, partial [Agrocybe pediades]